MSATSLRLPDEIKALAARVAEGEGKTPHAYLLEVVSERVKADAARQDFEAEAERRWKKMLRTGEYLAMEDVRAYVRALARGEGPERPKTRRMTAEELQRLKAAARRAR
jgi:predicted transcriptional regulator